MIRPKWPRRAALCQWRGLSSKLSSRRAQPSSNHPRTRKPRTEWPQLKRRAPSQSTGALLNEHTPGEADDTVRTKFRKAPRRAKLHWAKINEVLQHGTQEKKAAVVPIDKEESDEAFAAALRRKTSTKDEFVAKRGVSRGLGRSEVNWKGLATDAGKLNASKLNASKLNASNLGAGKLSEGPGRAELPWEKITKTPEQGSHKKDASSSSSNNRNMLLVRGVSTNLTASDFYRLAPNSLSTWESSIKKVQQQRDPKTFEPLGCYQVSFGTSSAATSYHANLTHLQRLARHKISPGSGLWQATAPAYLLRSDDPDEITRDVDRLTIASPSQAELPITHARTSVRYPWARNLTTLVEPLGYGPRPSVVLVDVSPGGLGAKDLKHFITQDGWQRDLAWSVSEPIPVDTKKTRNRFVIACETEWEARRFHRHWNQQSVTHSQEGVTTDRHVLSASIINW